MVNLGEPFPGEGVARAVPLDVPVDPAVAGDIREIADELDDTARRWAPTNPAAFLLITRAVIVTFEDFLEDPRMVSPREVRALEHSAIAARKFHIENRGWDPHEDLRARTVRALRQVRMHTFYSQFAPDDVTRGTSCHLAYGTSRATFLPVPNETAKQRRIRTTAYNLHRLREELGWTQKMLAKEVGVQRVQIVKWESGHNHEPSAENMEKLCEVLGVDEREFYTPVVLERA